MDVGVHRQGGFAEVEQQHAGGRLRPDARQGQQVGAGFFHRPAAKEFERQPAAVGTQRLEMAPLAGVSKIIAAKSPELMKQDAERNRQEGEAFLAQNGRKDGVRTLPSGLQYRVMRAGTGRTPKLTDTVSVNYRGTFIDGSEFDSSYRRGQPFVFQVNRMIKGWIEALQLMGVGAKWQLFIPPRLAYGEQGQPPAIGPNETLIYEVELLSIK